MEADPRTLPTWVTEWRWGEVNDEDYNTNYGRAGGTLPKRPEPSRESVDRGLAELERWANAVEEET